jgi:hypothetical protein
VHPAADTAAACDRNNCRVDVARDLPAGSDVDRLGDDGSHQETFDQHLRSADIGSRSRASDDPYRSALVDIPGVVSCQLQWFGSRAGTTL